MKTGTKVDSNVLLERESSVGDLNVLLVGESLNPGLKLIRSLSELKSFFTPKSCDVYAEAFNILSILQSRLTRGGVNLFVYTVANSGTATSRKVSFKINSSILSTIVRDEIVLELHDAKISVLFSKDDSVADLQNKIISAYTRVANKYFNIEIDGSVSNKINITTGCKGSNVNNWHVNVYTKNTSGLIEDFDNVMASEIGDYGNLLKTLQNESFDYVLMPFGAITDDFLTKYNNIYNANDNKVLNGFLVFPVMDDMVTLTDQTSYKYNKPTVIPVWFDLMDKTNNISYFNTSPSVLISTFICTATLVRTPNVFIGDFFPYTEQTGGRGGFVYANRNLVGASFINSIPQNQTSFGFDDDATIMNNLIADKGGVIFEINKLFNVVCGSTATSLTTDSNGNPTQHKDLSRWTQLFFLQRLTYKLFQEPIKYATLTKGTPAEKSGQISRKELIDRFEIFVSQMQEYPYAMISNSAKIRAEIVEKFDAMLIINYGTGSIVSVAQTDLVSPINEIFMTIMPINN